MENFFREPTLVALRELAMRQTAYAVESRHVDDTIDAVDHSRMPALRSNERVLLLIEADPASAALIRRGRRVADYLQADCLAVAVAKHPDLRDLEPQARETLQKQLNFARGLQIDARILEGQDVARHWWILRA